MNSAKACELFTVNKCIPTEESPHGPDLELGNNAEDDSKQGSSRHAQAFCPVGHAVCRSVNGRHILQSFDLDSQKLPATVSAIEETACRATD